MVYKLSPDEKVDSFSMGMISNAKIAGLVPFSYVQIDEDRTFKYNISGMKSLQNYFDGVVGKKKLTGALLSIVGVLDTISDYMLDEKMIILDVNHLFIQTDEGNAVLILLPIENHGVKATSIQVFFKEIVYSVTYDQKENCDYVAYLISYLNTRSSFKLEDFRVMLEKIYHSVVPMASNSNPQKELPVRPVEKPAKANITPTPPAVVKAMPQNNVQHPNMSAKPEEKANREKGVKSNKASHVEFDIPGVNKSFAVQNESNIKAAKKEKKNAVVNEKRSAFGNGLFKRKHANQTGNIEIINQSTDLEGTVLLSGSPRYQACLISESVKVRIPSGKNEFKIGKDESSVDYCISDNSTVSRQHASIICREGAYFIRDNHSTNGTKINGHPITPGMDIQLSNQANITFSDVSYKFVIELCI